MKFGLVFCALALLPVFAQTAALPVPDPAKPAQDAAKPATSPPAGEYSSKTFDVKYADPERLRDLFAGRSFVMEANRDLKTLTAHGSPAFLKEVEDAVTRFDVPAPPPANIQVTVYLITTAAQAPQGTALPPDLAPIAKEMTGAKLADSQMVRVRDGLGGETSGVAGAPNNARLVRVQFQSASLIVGPKGDEISVNGLKVWLDVPAVPVPVPATPDAGKSQLNTSPDITADVDVTQNQAVIVSKTGVDKPVAVLLRAAVVP
jgi:hypothetical protein